MIKKKFAIPAMIVCGILLLTGCKPTEKNYRAAYEAALAKREREAARDNLPTDMIRYDAPNLSVIKGDSVYTKNERLKFEPTDSTHRITGPYYVATSKYRMPTNAQSEATRLRDAGYEKASVAQTPENQWYTIVAGFETRPEAAHFIKSFRVKHPDYTYIGLPMQPLLITGY